MACSVRRGGQGSGQGLLQLLQCRPPTVASRSITLQQLARCRQFGTKQPIADARAAEGRLRIETFTAITIADARAAEGGTDGLQFLFGEFQRGSRLDRCLQALQHGRKFLDTIVQIAVQQLGKAHDILSFGIRHPLLKLIDLPGQVAQGETQTQAVDQEAEPGDQAAAQLLQSPGQQGFAVAGRVARQGH